VKKYANRLPLTYLFTEKPNKSNALNEILRNTTNEFIVFFDDDVRIHPDTLINYAKEVGDRTNGFFLCGRVSVDYEEKPPAWLLGYLPWSAKGWHLNDEKCKMLGPDGIGLNWGAFAIDMREAGGFDERRGPGSGARGQETDMMERLLNRNIVGYYLPTCEVWHLVPKNRCSPEWVLSRVFQVGVGVGIEISRAVFRSRAKRALISRIKVLRIRILLVLFGNRLEASRRFHYEYLKNRYSGILRGLKGT
jgi:glycosyltransferase involved in cell wall biosynthesis